MRVLQDDDDADDSPRLVRMPLLVALLIVVASGALAIRALRQWPFDLILEPSDDDFAANRPTSAVSPRSVPARPRPTATARPAPVQVITPRWVRPTPAGLVTLPARQAFTATVTSTPVQVTATPAVGMPPRLRHVSPQRLKRGRTTLLDVRGTHLRADHRVVLWKSGRPAPDVQVTRHKLVDPTLLQAIVVVGADVPKGTYDAFVVDPQGHRSNGAHFEITP